MDKKVLIVEDEVKMAQTLANRIAGLGYQAFIANDGEEAIESVKTHNPDLIILDIVMPKQNGFEVLEKLRVNLNFKNPVIVLSNLSSEEDMAQAKNLGVQHYLLKVDTSLKKIGQIVSETLKTP